MSALLASKARRVCLGLRLYLERVRIKLGPVSTLLGWICAPLILTALMMYMLVGFVALMFAPIFNLRIFDKIPEKTALWISTGLSASLVLYFIYESIHPSILNSSFSDLVLAYLIFVGVTGLIVLINVAILALGARFLEKLVNYPALQLMLFFLIALLVIGALSSNEIRDCEVVWTKRGPVCE
jgi:hypothetical protein